MEGQEQLLPSREVTLGKYRRWPGRRAQKQGQSVEALAKVRGGAASTRRLGSLFPRQPGTAKMSKKGCCLLPRISEGPLGAGCKHRRGLASVITVFQLTEQLTVRWAVR